MSEQYRCGNCGVVFEAEAPVSLMIITFVKQNRRSVQSFERSGYLCSNCQRVRPDAVIGRFGTKNPPCLGLGKSDKLDPAELVKANAALEGKQLRCQFSREWRPAFAWRPVRLVEGGWTWLRPVWKLPRIGQTVHTRELWEKMG